MSQARRTGRWRTGMQNKQRILSAARARFAYDGYREVSVRSVASDAGVDVAMVYYFFGNKDGLFRAALMLDRHPLRHLAELLDEGLDGIGERLVRKFVDMWDTADDLEPMLALWAAAMTNERAKREFEQVMLGPVASRLTDEFGIADAPLRVGMATVHLMGLAMARYRLQIHPLAAADTETLVAWVGPVVQRYLTGPSPDSSNF